MLNRLFSSLLLVTILLFTACQQQTTPADTGQERFTIENAALDKIAEIQPALFTPDNLQTQTFTVKAGRDTTLKCKAGTIFTIPKNTFVDAAGKPVSGPVDIEVKECLDKVSMVLGNMTTTTNGQFLESGGMVYINATANGGQLAIADGKSIGVEVPAAKRQAGMQLYEGEKGENGINWINPVLIADPAPKDKKEAPAKPDDEENFIEVVEFADTTAKERKFKRMNVGFTFITRKEVPLLVKQKLFTLVWGEEGLLITKDSLITIDDFEIRLVPVDTVSGMFVVRAKPSVTRTEVRRTRFNAFREDQETNYIFAVKKLGWANIDRLYHDSRTRQIDFVTAIPDHQEYSDIYISMIFRNQNMYLPGYQRRDSTFSFTHGDFEKAALPVGETATILATAYKDGKPFFALRTIQIQDNQKIDLAMHQTTMEEMKKTLEAKL